MANIRGRGTLTISMLFVVEAIRAASEEETVNLLKMTDDRNDTVHTYQEEVAQRIFGQIPQYARLMRRILDVLRLKISNGNCSPDCGHAH